MNSCITALDWRLIGALLAALFLFGILFNWLISRLGNRKDGYTAILVVVGVLVTLGALAVVSWQCALLALAMFAASGAPMVVGDIVRSIRKRESELKRLRELHNAEPTDSTSA